MTYKNRLLSVKYIFFFTGKGNEDRKSSLILRRILHIDIDIKNIEDKDININHVVKYEED